MELASGPNGHISVGGGASARGEGITYSGSSSCLDAQSGRVEIKWLRGLFTTWVTPTGASSLKGDNIIHEHFTASRIGAAPKIAAGEGEQARKPEMLAKKVQPAKPAERPQKPTAKAPAPRQQSETAKPSEQPAPPQPAVTPQQAARECASGDAIEKIRSCTQLIDSGSMSKKDLATAYTSRGYAYRDGRDTNRAILDFDKVIEFDPRNAAILAMRGTLYLSNREFDLAIADLTRAIEIDPQYVLAYSNRGVAWQATGQTDKALADFAKAIELAPRDAFIYAQRAGLHAGKGAFELAVADYAEAIELFPNEPTLHREQADVWLQMGKYEQAMAEFTKAITLAPRDAGGYRDRAVAAAVRGDLPGLFPILMRRCAWTRSVGRTTDPRGHARKNGKLRPCPCRLRQGHRSRRERRRCLSRPGPHSGGDRTARARFGRRSTRLSNSPPRAPRSLSVADCSAPGYGSFRMPWPILNAPSCSIRPA